MAVTAISLYINNNYFSEDLHASQTSEGNNVYVKYSIFSGIVTWFIIFVLNFKIPAFSDDFDVNLVDSAGLNE
jgi:hypothetical protein